MSFYFYENSKNIFFKNLRKDRGWKFTCNYRNIRLFVIGRFNFYAFQILIAEDYYLKTILCRLQSHLSYHIYTYLQINHRHHRHLHHQHHLSPVSYTHLDVYKRQSLNHPLQKFPPEFSFLIGWLVFSTWIWHSPRGLDESLSYVRWPVPGISVKASFQNHICYISWYGCECPRLLCYSCGEQ